MRERVCVGSIRRYGDRRGWREERREREKERESFCVGWWWKDERTNCGRGAKEECLEISGATVSSVRVKEKTLYVSRNNYERAERERER